MLVDMNLPLSVIQKLNVNVFCGILNPDSLDIGYKNTLLLRLYDTHICS